MDIKFYTHSTDSVVVDLGDGRVYLRTDQAFHDKNVTDNNITDVAPAALVAKAILLS